MNASSVLSSFAVSLVARRRLRLSVHGKVGLAPFAHHDSAEGGKADHDDGHSLLDP